MNWLHWIRDRWHARQREIDLKILWPECRRATPDLDLAKAAFTYHTSKDPAWAALSEVEIYWIVDKLE